MGSMCCGSPSVAQVRTTPEDLIPKKREIIAIETETPVPEEEHANNSKKSVTGEELWRELHLENELLVKIIHPHILVKTLENSANA